MRRVLIASLSLALGVSRMVIGGPPCSNENGNVNGDEDTDLSDAIYTLEHLFQGGPAPEPFCIAPGPPADGCAVENADTNADQAIDLSDVIYLLTHLFQGGPPPVPICPRNGESLCDGMEVLDLTSVGFHVRHDERAGLSRVRARPAG